MSLLTTAFINLQLSQNEKVNFLNLNIIIVKHESEGSKNKLHWEGDARGRRYGDICLCIADSLCFKAETNTPL